MRPSFWRGPGRWGVLPALLTLVAAGCGTSTGTVSGKVTYKGNPVTGGNITFIPPPGHATVSVPINEDGTYTAEKVPTVNMKVCVETDSLRPNKGGGGGAAPKYSPPAGATAPPGYLSGPAKKGVYVQIPPKYAQPDSTDLSYTVKSGKQEFNAQLQ